MSKILGMTAALALMLGAYALPVSAAHHEANPCNPCAIKTMKDHNPCDVKNMKKDNPCSMQHKKMNPCNPCSMK